MIKKDYYSVIDNDLLNKLFLMLEKLQRAHHTLNGPFAPAYLGGSSKLRAYLFFIYGATLCLIFIKASS